MITGWNIYWITRLDGFKEFLTILTVLLVSAILVLVIMRAVVWDPYFEWEKKFATRWLKPTILLTIIALVVILLSLCIPTAKEAAAIHLIPKIASNEQVQKLPDNATKFLNQKFEEWISDMAGKGGK